MTILEISAAQRRALRAQAHALHPVVRVGDRGLAPSVLKEIDHSLQAHELIKVRVTSGERTEREAILAQLCDTLSCAAVHHLGKVLIIYRPQGDTALEGPTTGTLPAAAGRKPRRPTKKQAAQALPARPAAQAPHLRAAGGASAARIPRRTRPLGGSALSLRAGRRARRSIRS